MELVIKFGAEIGLKKDEIDILSHGAMLHDIGKQQIPNRILQKKGPLTERERAFIKMHPKIGYDLLKNSGIEEKTLHIVLYHHERIDGRGYPCGLQGNAIPKLARILSIVDAYDAMTYNRVYRKALDHETALKEIENNIGTQFDPEFGDAFLHIYRKHKPYP